MTPDRLTRADLDDVALGARLLGSGGGGRVELVTSLLRDRLMSHSLPVRRPHELPAETLCLPVATVGSSTIGSERMLSSLQFLRLAAAVEQRLGNTVGAIAALEGAGINALIPALAASTLDLELVDADGMGRAFSRIDHTTFALGGVPLTPCFLVGRAGEVVCLDVPHSANVESLLRPVVAALGGWAVLGCYAQTAVDLSRHGIGGYLQHTGRLGSRLRRARTDGLTRDALAHAIGAHRVMSGRVAEVRPDPGHPQSRSITVVTVPPEREQVLRLDAHNEFQLAVLDGRPVAAVPSIICPLHRGSAEPVNVEDVHLDQPLDVLVLPPAAPWLTSAGLSLAGPRAHGIDMELPATIS